MSIKIRFEKGALVVQHSLKDEALSKLMTLVMEEGDEGSGPFQILDPAIPPLGQIAQPSTPIPPTLQTVLFPEKFAKEWLAKHGAAEVLNKLAWDTYPDKILALGAYHESKAGEDFDSWRSSDIGARFSEAKDSLPANFPRDIAAAIKSGYVTTKTPRTYIVSRTGWIKVSEAISKLGI